MLRMSKSVTTGTIAAANTSQVLQAALPRIYVEIINTSDTIMYINFGAVATTAHIPLAANGGKLVYDKVVPQNSINIICGTINKTYCYLIQ